MDERARAGSFGGLGSGRLVVIDAGTLQRLLAHGEKEWIEHNDADPDDVGTYLSALANAAALHGQEAGWLLWGIEDGTRRPVGTDVEPRARKNGNEPAETSCARLLSPRIDFAFHEVVDAESSLAACPSGRDPSFFLPCLFSFT
jgi:predicted HTH transcriptional regulator